MRNIHADQMCDFRSGLLIFTYRKFCCSRANQTTSQSICLMFYRVYFAHLSCGAVYMHLFRHLTATLHAPSSNDAAKQTNFVCCIFFVLKVTIDCYVQKLEIFLSKLAFNHILWLPESWLFQYNCIYMFLQFSMFNFVLFVMWMIWLFCPFQTFKLSTENANYVSTFQVWTFDENQSELKLLSIQSR